MFDEGKSLAEISEATGKTEAAVRRTVERHRREGRTIKLLNCIDGAGNNELSNANFIEPHKPRAIRKVLNGGARSGAQRNYTQSIKLFASGAIDRKELMSRIAA